MLPTVDEGSAIAATATGPDNSTSEFSNDVMVSAGYPAPILIGVASSTLVAGAGSTTITVTGQDFVAASVVEWTQNGVTTDLATSYIDDRRMTALVPASLLQTAGAATVTVFTPGPGGGASAGQTVTIVGTPKLSLTVTQIQRQPWGVVVQYSVNNFGTSAAADVRILSGRLVGGATVGQSIGPVTLSALTGSVTGTFTLPKTTQAGTKIVQVAGTANGGVNGTVAFSLSRPVVIP